jgi:myo-inositol-1(or 4)-monophosphatase
MNLESITSRVIDIAGEAASFIREQRAVFRQEDIEEKGTNDLVSYVDRHAEEMLVERLRKLVPEAGFLTEEKTTVQEEKDLMWIIDPLDGTTNFIHNIPAYAVSVGLVERGIPIVGVVYEVTRSECFSAWKGGGAWLNGARISVSNSATIKDSLFSTGFPIYNFEHMDQYLAILNELMRNAHGLRRMGSSAIDLSFVACGRFEAYFEYNLSPWDIAAGILLVQEAGGTVTDFRGGNEFLYGRELCAGGAVHPALLEVIQKFWKSK